jgi:hypothetical protein
LFTDRLDRVRLAGSTVEPATIQPNACQFQALNLNFLRKNTELTDRISDIALTTQ